MVVGAAMMAMAVSLGGIPRKRSFLSQSLTVLTTTTFCLRAQGGWRILEMKQAVIDPLYKDC